METMMAALLWSRASSRWAFVTAFLASPFVCHGQQARGRSKQQVEERSKHDVKPDEKKNGFQKLRLRRSEAQELLGALTQRERMDAVGRRSGDGDEVKHGADGSAASLLGLRRADMSLSLSRGHWSWRAPVGVGQTEAHV